MCNTQKKHHQTSRRSLQPESHTSELRRGQKSSTFSKAGDRLGKTEKSTSEYSKHQIVNDMGIRVPEHQEAIKAELASQLSNHSLERNGKKKAYANINRLGHEDCSRYEMTHSGPFLPLLPSLPYFYRPRGLATGFSICKLNWGDPLQPMASFPDNHARSQNQIGVPCSCSAAVALDAVTSIFDPRRDKAAVPHLTIDLDDLKRTTGCKHKANVGLEGSTKSSGDL